MLTLPGYTGGTPLLPITAVVTGTPLVENSSVLEGEHTPPAHTEIDMETLSEDLRMASIHRKDP